MHITYSLKPQEDRLQERFVIDPNVPFGSQRTDHVLVREFKGGVWGSARIVPYHRAYFTPGSEPGDEDELIVKPGAKKEQYGYQIFLLFRNLQSSQPLSRIFNLGEAGIEPATA